MVNGFVGHAIWFLGYNAIQFMRHRFDKTPVKVKGEDFSFQNTMIDGDTDTSWTTGSLCIQGL